MGRTNWMAHDRHEFSKMDNLESTITYLLAQVTELMADAPNSTATCRSSSAAIGCWKAGSRSAHLHGCPHCGAWAVCPSPSERIALQEANAPADCRDEPYTEE